MWAAAVGTRFGENSSAGLKDLLSLSNSARLSAASTQPKIFTTQPQDSTNSARPSFFRVELEGLSPSSRRAVDWVTKMPSNLSYLDIGIWLFNPLGGIFSREGGHLLWGEGHLLSLSVPK